jgi:hypothetical protein
MEQRRSSIVQRSRTQKSIKSSLIRQTESSSPINAFFVDDQKDISAKNFVRSCPYRVEDIDRNAIIK